MREQMNTLVYKRTHSGDPDESGIFGIHDCMGRFRGWPFDAVIGVGGKCPRSRDKGLARKINWVGIDPCKSEASSPIWLSAKRSDWAKVFHGPLVAFEYFAFWGEEGPEFGELAPDLYSHIFEDHHHRRFVMSQNLTDENMQEEVHRILIWAKKHYPGGNPSILARQDSNSTAAHASVCGKNSSTQGKC